MFRRLIIKFLAFSLGSSLCFYAHASLNVSPVLASACIGLWATFIPLPDSFDPKNVHSAIYCGSFAGMCSADFLSSFTEIVLLSAIGGILFLSVRNLFHGFGGKLGTVAFISVALMYLIRSLI